MIGNAKSFYGWFTVISILAMNGCSPSQVELLSVDAGEGSAEPNLSVSPEGDVVLSYLVPVGEETALRFHTMGANGWSAATTIVQAPNLMVNWADFPSVLPLSNRVMAAHWLTCISSPSR